MLLNEIHGLVTPSEFHETIAHASLYLSMLATIWFLDFDTVNELAQANIELQHFRESATNYVCYRSTIVRQRIVLARYACDTNRISEEQGYEFASDLRNDGQRL